MFLFKKLFCAFCVCVFSRVSFIPSCVWFAHGVDVNAAAAAASPPLHHPPADALYSLLLLLRVSGKRLCIFPDLP